MVVFIDILRQQNQALVSPPQLQAENRDEGDRRKNRTVSSLMCLLPRPLASSPELRKPFHIPRR
jgi:hypothetical protein